MKITNKNIMNMSLSLAAKSEIEEFAASELRKYLGQIFGFEPAVSSLPESENAIFVGMFSELLPTEYETFFLKNKGNDCYAIFERNNCLHIYGSGRSLLYAVYHFLEILGCRWFYPRKSEQIVPVLDSFNCCGVEVKKVIDMRIRGINLEPLIRKDIDLTIEHIDWMAKNRFNVFSSHPGVYGTDLWSTDFIRWDSVADDILPELKKRGIMLNMHVHNLFHFMPPEKYYHAHPEWYALRGEGKIWGYCGSKETPEDEVDVVAGNLERYFEDPVAIMYPYEVNERQKTYPEWLQFKGGQQIPSQICYANPEAVECYKNNVIDYVKAHPEVDILGLWPSDGGNFCQCEECKNDPLLIFNVVNYLAKEIYKENQNVLVEHIAYGERSLAAPPDDCEISPNLIFFICSFSDAWRKWIKCHPEHICYVGDYKNADNYNRSGMVLINPALSFSRMGELRDLGMAGCSSFYIETASWWRSSLNLYFWSRFCCDSEASTEELVADYIQAYCPEAAQTIKTVLLDIVFPDDIASFLPAEKTDFSETIELLNRAVKEFKEIKKQNCRIENFVAYALFASYAIKVFDLRCRRLEPVEQARWRQIVEISLDIARLEDKMAGVAQESVLAGDGVLDLRYLVYRRKWRFEEDLKIIKLAKRNLNMSM